MLRTAPIGEPAWVVLYRQTNSDARNRLTP
jgi:hypothetical protein